MRGGEASEQRPRYDGWMRGREKWCGCAGGEIDEILRQGDAQRKDDSILVTRAAISGCCASM